MERWPNFFIVGAPKAGTTSLYQYLTEIPGIYMSPVKEPRYFSPNVPLGFHAKIIRDKKKYLELFEEVKNEKTIGEASTSYMQDPESAKLIYQVIPNAKIIIILRDPIERTFSHYLTDMEMALEKISFDKLIRMKSDEFQKFPYLKNILDASLYSVQVKRYVDTFGFERLKILVFEELVKNTKDIVQDVLKFLDLDYQIQNFEAQNYNPYTAVRMPLAHYLVNTSLVRKISHHLISPSVRQNLREKFLFKNEPRPKISEKDRTFLQNLFRDDVQKLCSLLGKQLPWSGF